MLDLEALAFFRRERLVVGYFRHERGNVFAEAARDLIPIDVLIFDRVMDEPRNDEVRVLSACGLCTFSANSMRQFRPRGYRARHGLRLASKPP